MKLTILAVGHRQPDWVRAGCAEYVKRMPRELATEILELKPDPRNTGRSAEQIMRAEGERLQAALTQLRDIRTIALDEKGSDLTTQAFARWLEAWMQEGRDVAFLIGGADGLAPELKAAADARLRLSSLTLPHGLARLLLCEQLYRAASLLKNHPYHRA
ncbi:MAG: 23S rRNA (pseudouridine(1915)-N(3))-methyltransferase RlmH [Zoogloeaceae bacterium]|jgi:23S rRNA (pseudouridine1915-N3)-methyltransferase|nr:23S rRNA (pseudouridine(1915)-N(3))-methyltransferase RlmH [Zoogloeaceae bacterium]